MTTNVRHRLIKERVFITEEEIAERQRLCADFRDEMQRSGYKPKRFCTLAGVSPVSGYRWVSPSAYACPPPVYVRRFLWLLSNCPCLEKQAILCPIKLYNDPSHKYYDDLEAGS